MTAGAWVSILHRASGAIMFLLLPFIIWMFDKSISSEFSYAKFTALFNIGAGFVPGWFFKLVALALIWPSPKLLPNNPQLPRLRLACR